MPIVPLWTNLIIIFEMTMLSAIIATVITLLITAGLPSRGGKLYDPEVSDGYILVGVENPSDAARLEPALAIDGGRVKTNLKFHRFADSQIRRRRTHGQQSSRPRSAAPGFAGRAPHTDEGRKRVTLGCCASLVFGLRCAWHGRRPSRTVVSHLCNL